MSLVDTVKSLKSRDVFLAWVVAIAADTIEIAALPLFAEGALSPADDILDFAVAGALVHLLGWHWAFLPSMMAKLVPGLDLFPTWTSAVWFVTRNSPLPENIPAAPRRIGEAEILPPEPSVAQRK